MFQINNYSDSLVNLCNSNAAVNKMYLFGSVLSHKFNDETSDIDILVEVSTLSPEERGEWLLELWDGLETLFNRKVDLLTENSLRNPFLKKEIEQTKKLIYDRESRKIFI